MVPGVVLDGSVTVPLAVVPSPQVQMAVCVSPASGSPKLALTLTTVNEGGMCHRAVWRPQCLWRGFAVGVGVAGTTVLVGHGVGVFVGGSAVLVAVAVGGSGVGVAVVVGTGVVVLLGIGVGVQQ